MLRFGIFAILILDCLFVFQFYIYTHIKIIVIKNISIIHIIKNDLNVYSVFITFNYVSLKTNYTLLKYYILIVDSEFLLDKNVAVNLSP